MTSQPELLTPEEQELLTPELVTSVGDFERLYGSTTALEHGESYLAHAVRGFFANGGRRLYVARVFQRISEGNTGRAASAYFVGAAADPVNARFEARFPGSAGNGRITVTQLTAPASAVSLANALEGTMIRTGGADAATPGTATGGVPSFRVVASSRLRLEVGGAPGFIEFLGRRAEVTGTTPLPEEVTLVGDAPTLTVTINGFEQVIALPQGPTPRASFVLAINEALQGGGFATLTPANMLMIGSEIHGRRSNVTVLANEPLGFEADDADDAEPDSNVGDLNAVTADEIRALLVAQAIPLTVSLDAATSELILTTEATGSTATINVVDGTTSAHGALGFTLGPQSPGTNGQTVQYYVKSGSAWLDSTNMAATLDPVPAGGIEFVTINVEVRDADGFSQSFEDLAFSSAHPSYIGNVLAGMPARRHDQLENLVMLATNGTVSPFGLRTGLLGAAGAGGADPERRVSVMLPLGGGNDGAVPSAERFREGFQALDSIEGVSIVAAPGSSANPEHPAIRTHLIEHVEQRRAYKIAVLDPPQGQSISQVREIRATMDSHYAALYYPWLVVPNPDAVPGDRSRPSEIRVPPSGHVCGVYARSDAERGVHKAPANEVLRGVLRFETNVNMRQQEVLNPEGINALRSFPGRGHRIWGARLASSDPELKYVNVRRYLNYIAATLDRGTQWVVFEPNGELLWDRVRSTVRDFLYDEWLGGALLGRTQDEAFFVRCDRSVMTQNDLDNGRLICEVGMAIVKPAEFVIFRIGQKTATASA